VDAIERYGNRRQRVEQLTSAWNQGIRRDADFEDGADDPLIDAAAEPSKRPRTRLTDKEVDAIRTARGNGVSVLKLAKQFGVHRGTVWAKTRTN
jgi:site-specific DNA recombinase